MYRKSGLLYKRLIDMATVSLGMTYISNIVTYGGYKYIGCIDGHDLGDVFVPEYTTQRAYNEHYEHNDIYSPLTERSLHDQALAALQASRFDAVVSIVSPFCLQDHLPLYICIISASSVRAW